MKKIGLLFIVLFALSLSGCGVKKASDNKDLNQQKINLNEINNEEIKLVVAQRLPEGTQNALVDESKVIRYPLSEVSVTFNKDIDQETLNIDNFYALWGIEDKVPATISYDSKEKKATLKFDKPITSSGEITRITIVLNNIKSENTSIDDYSYNIDILN